MQVNGLASGQDWNAIIQQLMYLERAPIRQWQARQNTLTVTKDAWNDVNNRLLNLKTRTSDLLSADLWGAKSVTTGDSSVVSASVLKTAENGSYDIKVKQLAQEHRVSSDYTADAAAAIGAGDGSGSYTFEINGETITVSDDYSLNDVRDAINAHAWAVEDNEVSANIISGHLVIKAANTGTDYAMTFNSDPDDVLETIGVLDGTKAIKNELYAAQNLIFTIDGIEVEKSENTGITDVLTGVTLNFNGVSEKSGAETWPDDYTATKLTVSDNTNSAANTITNWVNQYNSTMAFMKTQTTYDLDTESGGPLVGSGTAQRIENEVASIVFSRYTDTDLESLAEIGITLGEYGTSEQDKLVIDSDKLNAALADDPDAVRNLFSYDSSGDGTRDSGIAIDLNNYLDPITRTTGIIKGEMNSIQTTIDSFTDRIISYERILEMRENGLRRTFTDLEMAMARFQSTSNWLTGQLSNLSG